MKRARRGRVNSLGQGSLDISGELWDIGAVLYCLVSGPGDVLGQGKYWFVRVR